MKGCNPDNITGSYIFLKRYVICTDYTNYITLKTVFT